MASTSVFSSVGQALHVSYLIEALPATRKSPTQTFINDLLREAGKLVEVDREDRAIDFRGLDPLELRGQCAMVRATVDHHCAPPERAAILAWYSQTSLKAEGMRTLREYVAPRLTIRSEHAQMQMLWAVHTTGRISQAQIAEDAGVSQPTVSRNVREIGRVAGQLRRQGRDRLQPLFERTGLIAEEVPA